MSARRVHLPFLKRRYGDCGEAVGNRLGTQRQGSTVVIADKAAFEQAVEECKKPVPLTAARAVHGAKGIAAAIAGHVARQVARQPDPPYVAERHTICKGCDQWKDGKVQTCKKCGCATWAKIRGPKESCPLNPQKWGPEAEKTNDGV